MAASPSAMAAAISAAGGGGSGGGLGSGLMAAGGGAAGGGGGGGRGKGVPSILAQAAVTAAWPTRLAFCCRFTALCMAMPSVSSSTASSMPKACEGAWPAARVRTPVTESTIWLFTVLSSVMSFSLLG